mmetsp:Transcript_8335/g.12182  ORF Transcript_8335/g.12182 Transcript_8335/m.12182 type:complete len:412 (+) Transcript_8335:790-2025(+)
MLRRLKSKVKLERVTGQNGLLLKRECPLMLGIQSNLPASLLTDNILYFILLGNRRSVQVANVELVQHLGRLGRVNCNEVLSRILSSIDEDGVSSTRVKIEVFGTIVHLVVDNDPNIFLLVVLTHLCSSNALITLSSGCGGRCSLLLHSLTLLKKTSESSRIGFLRELGHPSTLLLSRSSGVLKLEDVLAIDILGHVHLNTEDLVVTHAHQVPGGVIGLAVVCLIPSTAPNLLAANQISNLQVIVPPHPAPIHTIISRFLNLINLRHLPVLSTIGTNLGTSDTASSSSVGISSHIVSAGNVGCKIDSLIVVRCRHGRVDVKLIEDVFGLVPPSTSQRLLGSNMWRQDTIVMIMVVVFGLMLDDVNVSEPLDHTSTDVSRDDETDGESVIRLELLSVSLVGDEDVVGGVHGAG